jgi:uncharacterized coiled-coil DUF342 family protein
VFQQLRDARTEVAAARTVCDQRHEQVLEMRGDLKEIRAELRALRGEVHEVRVEVVEIRDTVKR